MRRRLTTLSFLLPLLTVIAATQSAVTPAATLPYTPSLDPASMDRTADPCVDFYQYACGGWLKNNPIPADQASWSVYGKLSYDNQRFLWGLLLEAAQTGRARTASEQKIGDYFSACTDEAAVERLGAQPLQPVLSQIAAIRTAADGAAFLGRQHLSTSGSHLVFGAGADQDLTDSTRVIAWVTAGGLSLPDRDYYLNTDAKSQETRAKYVEHVQRMLQLLGDDAAAAGAGAEAVMRIETALARATLTRVERRDPYKISHKMALRDLQALTPALDWSIYFTAAGLPGVDTLNVTEPEFFRALDELIRTEPLEAWQAYLRWHVVHDKAQYLSSKFVQEDFDFYRRHLRGVSEQQPRWKRCVAWTDRDLGEALGQVFVARTFAPDTRARALKMTQEIEQAMEARIQELPWMGAETKRQALEKLHAIVNKIGYPDRWRDYGALEIRPGDFFGNVDRAAIFESRRQLGKIGRPVDRGEWAMTPPTVNAYYSPQMNDINFPAGVLQPPLFDPKMDDAPNYGNTGGTIGHELTHGFDDEGRQFDAKGNLRDWWTKQDAEEFEKRAACISDQYSKYTVVDDIRINGKLTLGEDVADLGGTILAYLAWKKATAGQTLQPKDGLTPDQRFFVGYSQWACENQRPENLRVNAATNPHSPGKYRVNGLMVNMPEWQQAFGCRAGQPMTKPADQICRVW